MEILCLLEYGHTDKQIYLTFLVQIYQLIDCKDWTEAQLADGKTSRDISMPT